MYFFRRFNDHNSWREMKIRKMNPFFSSIFSALTVCNIHFWIWKYSKFTSMWSPLWSILVCKIPSFFYQKLPIRTAHHTFMESRYPEVTKNLYYLLSTCQSQIPIFSGSSSWTSYLFLWIHIFWEKKEICF